MIKIENQEVLGFEHAIRGMRNPMNSWDKSDSGWTKDIVNEKCEPVFMNGEYGFFVGDDDIDLMTRLSKAGTDHRKFMRMITVYLDITAPLYWWKEFDTYKVGTVANSCSTMHKIHTKQFDASDFSCENMDEDTFTVFTEVLKVLEKKRCDFCISKDKEKWYSIIQMLPSSYNQKRTVMLNYEVLANIYHSRKTHKLDEWRDLCAWIENLPYSELITQCRAN